MEFLKHITLDRPIVFYDLETTGVNIATDKIVSISAKKINPDGSIESKYSLINPLIPIPPASTEVHKITNEMVKESPSFKNISKAMYDFFDGCDVAGYNLDNFDNGLLHEEFYRCGYDFPNPEKVSSIDAFTIFKKYEKRDLASALRFYCGKEMVDAHNAEADNSATIEIVGGQLERYDELKGKTVKELCDSLKTENRVDWAGRIIKDDKGDYVFNFGSAKGTKVKDNKGFAKWCLDKDFPESFKDLLRKILE